MKNTEEKIFEWGTFYRNGELVACILGILIALVGFRGELEATKLIVVIIFLLIGVLAMIHFIYLTTNKTYVSVNGEGINVASRYSKSGGRYANWTDVSKVEKDDRKKLLTLSVTKQDDIKIFMGSLNKEDREDLAKIINEAVGTHPES